MKNQFVLLKQRRFLPFFVTQFLGAFNDNLYKTLVSVLIAYGLWDIGGHEPGMLVALAAGLFVIPFVLFMPLAGDITDKFDKSRIMRFLKITEILIVLAGLAALYFRSIPGLMAMVFALGAQSAFFSPGKFSIMPQHLPRDELIAGNALVNTGTYLAILFGTILGSLLAVSHVGLVIGGLVLLLCAAAGYMASRFIPPAPANAPDLRLNFNVVFEAVRIIQYAYKQPNGVFSALISASWFFFVGGLYLSQFPNFANQTLGVDHIVLTGFMSVFSVGIAVGGLLNNRLLKSQVSAAFVPLAALMIALFSLDLYFASQPYLGVPDASKQGHLIGLTAFLSHLSGWRIMLDLFLVALAGGLYAVPLKTIIQDRTSPDHCARVMAGSALMDALFVMVSAVVAIGVYALGYAPHHLFLIVAALSLPVGVYVVIGLRVTVFGYQWKGRTK